MSADKIIEASAKLAEGLRDNPASEDFIFLIQLIVIFLFIYFFVRLIIEGFKKSRMERLAEKYESTLSEANGVMSKVVIALERLGN